MRVYWVLSSLVKDEHFFYLKKMYFFANKIHTLIFVFCLTKHDCTQNMILHKEKWTLKWRYTDMKCLNYIHSCLGQLLLLLKFDWLRLNGA